MTWLREYDWSLAILDEAQAIKNSGTRQSRAAKELRTAGRIALTGTPVENRLSDLWSLFDFLNPGLLGSAKAFARFIKKMEAAPSPSYQPLRSLVQPYILRRLKTDKRVIADLPDKTEVKAYCGLTRQQAALYEQVVRDLREQLEAADGIQRRGLVLAQLMRLKQICNHPAQLLGHGDYDAKHSSKIQRLAELCEEMAAAAGKGAHFHAVPRDRRAAGAVPGRRVWPAGSGACTAARRSASAGHWWRHFQRENGPPFFVLSLKAGGTGLNLTAASQVIHFDRWWNPAVENQATDRAFRIGQKRNVLVHKFVCRGTVEERIDALIAEKSRSGARRGRRRRAVVDGDGERGIAEVRGPRRSQSAWNRRSECGRNVSVDSPKGGSDVVSNFGRMSRSPSAAPRPPARCRNAVKKGQSVSPVRHRRPNHRHNVLGQGVVRQYGIVQRLCESFAARPDLCPQWFGGGSANPSRAKSPRW